MRALIKLSAWCLSLCLSTGAAVAQDDAIGYIKTVQGDAVVVTAGQSVPAVAGAALKRGQTLRTGRDASVGVTLKDNTMLSAGSDSELTVDDFNYAPGTDELKLAIRIAKGSLYYISGVIAKLKPAAVTIKTPTGLIGVRGTELVAHVAPGDQS
jgi:hypothetical protein